MEGHLLRDHIRICMSIPPKYAVTSVIGFIKGNSGISIAWSFMGWKRNFTGENFWARAYYVSTVGLAEEAVRKYIREQEAEDARLQQLNLFHDETPLQGAHGHAPFDGLTGYAPGSPGGHFTAPRSWLIPAWFCHEIAESRE